MNRPEFEHVIAVAAEVSGEDELVVIGSQAILGSHPEAPEALLVSLEADVYPMRAPEKADLIDGALGDGSPFHRSFGYYAHGVAPETAVAPAGWQQRLVRYDVPARVASARRAVAWCLEPHDLVLAKCVAGRERDWAYARTALSSGLVEVEVLLSRIDVLPVSADIKERIRLMLPAPGAESPAGHTTPAR
jgi:hypothetical protein